jgi:hypothetical protein
MVASTPGAVEKIEELVECVKAKGMALVGCRSGHHRSPAVASIAAPVLQNTYGLQCKAWPLCRCLAQALRDRLSRAQCSFRFSCCCQVYHLGLAKTESDASWMLNTAINHYFDSDRCVLCPDADYRQQPALTAPPACGLCCF